MDRLSKHLPSSNNEVHVKSDTFNYVNQNDYANQSFQANCLKQTILSR
jgi:hypothetical protein